MPYSELAFEVMALALETVRGTGVTPPTHIMNMTGSITPVYEEYFPADQVGHLSEYERSEIVRKSAEWEAEGGADITKLPLLANMVFAPLTTGVAAGGLVTGTTSLVGGSGYVPASQVDAFTITVGAPAAGGRQAVIYATTSGGVITSLRVADPGSNYTSAPALTFTGHTGTGASATATVSAVATIAKQWDFIRVMSSDTIKSATMYWGDPNAVVYKSIYSMANELTLSGDSSSTDGVMSSISGIGQAVTELTGGSIPAMPTVSVSPLLVPSAMELWMESGTSNAFGTTAVSGRLVSAEYTCPNGVVPKFLATGPAGGISYSHVGRNKTHPELKIALELADTTQTALFIAGTTVKARVAYNNTTLIESGQYPRVMVDIEGKLGQLSWGDLEGANRTVEFTISGVYSSQLASDARMIIVNSSASL